MMKNNMHALKTIAMTALLGLAGLAQAGIPIQHWTQPSGAGVWLVEAPTVPVVDVRIEFDAGGRRDPATQAGLAAASVGLMSKGVRAAGQEPGLDENALGEAWADLGASFGGSDSGDRVSFALRSLTYPDLLARAAALAARQLAEPAFPAQVWTRERERLVAALREANMRPATIAARTFTASEFDLLRARVDAANREPFVAQTENTARVALRDPRRLVNLPAEQPVVLTSTFASEAVSIDESEVRRLMADRPLLARRAHRWPRRSRG